MTWTSWSKTSQLSTLALARVFLALAVWIAVGSWLARPAVAGEPYVSFLRALQKAGYGEQALAYIEQIAPQPDLPADLKQTLDIERSNSLRIAAEEAYNAEQRESRLAESKALLEKFQKENPSHPALSSAIITWGDEALTAGQMSLGMFRATRDKAEQDKHLAEARVKLSEGRRQFEEAEKRIKAHLAGSPAPSKEARQDLELTSLESRFKIAQADYLLAQAYADPKDPKRKALLEASGKGFDAIFQKFRGTRVGFEAHLWHGKTIEDLGDAVTAMDVYDEVLVISPEGKDAVLDDAPLFGQAALWRLRLVAKTKKPQVTIEEGEEWLKSHTKWAKTRAYQGIALEVSKAKVTAADSLKPTEQRKFLREVAAALLNISKVDSEFQNEAVLLRQEVLQRVGSGEAKLTADESLALGDDAAGRKNWASATEFYNKSLETATQAKDAKRIAEAQERLSQVRYRVALDHYNEDRMEEAYKLAGQIVKEIPGEPVAESASALAVSAALSLYENAAADAKPAALERLQRVASFTVKTWPDKAVADEARMSMARAQMLKGETAAALKVLDEVKSQSKRYPAAQQIAAQISWKLYLDARKAPDAANRAAELEEYRNNAKKHLEVSLERQRAEQPSGITKLSQAVFDTQLLLSEVLLEAKQPAESAALFMPLVKDLQANKPKTIDNTTLRVFVGAVRAELAAEKVNEAGEAAVALLEMSDDTPQLNAILVDFSKLITSEWKQAEADLIKAESDANPQAVAAQQTRVAACKQVLGQLLEKLTARQQHTVQNLVYLGDTCAVLALHEKAREIYQRVTTLIERDDTAKATAGKAVTRIRSQLIGLLRSEGKFEEASKQVDQLIKANPTALEPLMEKGRILQDWSQRDAKKLDDCVAHWTTVRMLLGRMKTRPPEYYEALYNAAFCLVRQAGQTKDKEKGLHAEQMLKSTLTLSPKLSGPDMVAKYEALLKAALKVQGKSEAPAKPAPPAASASK